MDRSADTRHELRTPETRSRRRRHAIPGALTLLLLLYAGIWSYRFAVVEFGPFGLFTGVLILGLLVLLSFPALLLWPGAPLRRGALRVAASIRALLRVTGLPRRTTGRFPRVSRFVAARFALGTATGLGLTAGLTLATAIAWVFVELLVEVVTGNPIVAMDRRMLDLAASLRTPQRDHVMLAFTFLGNGHTVLALLAITVIGALVVRCRDAAGLLVLSVCSSSLFFGTVKQLVDRPRPPLESARLVQGGLSFPSGHATLSAAFYGTLAYLLMHAVAFRPARILIAVCAAMLAFLIGISRVYLGVHYPSDVLAGWTAGTLWLVLVIIVEHVRPRRATGSPSQRQRFAAVALTCALLLLVGPYLYSVYLRTPPHPGTVRERAVVVPAEKLPEAVLAHTPQHSETLFGDKAEPVSLVLAGTQAELEHAFRLAGWISVRDQGIVELAQAVAARVLQRPSPATPVAPSFLSERPNVFAFARPEGADAARHLVRIWRMPLETDRGQRVWLATAAFDRGLELAPITLLPVHRIASDAGPERDYVVGSLKGTGAVAKTASLRLAPAGQTSGAAADPSAGSTHAVLVWLRPLPSATE